jgi:hypothetical protein
MDNTIFEKSTVEPAMDLAIPILRIRSDSDLNLLLFGYLMTAKLDQVGGADYHSIRDTHGVTGWKFSNAEIVLCSVFVLAL